MPERRDRTFGNEKGIAEQEARQLLTLLCAKYGFCLPPLWRNRLIKNPPKSVDKFTDTVFRAEGFDLETCDRKLYEKIQDEVSKAFVQSQD